MQCLLTELFYAPDSSVTILHTTTNTKVSYKWFWFLLQNSVSNNTASTCAYAYCSDHYCNAVESNEEQK
jgi:hypothetical protein